MIGHDAVKRRNGRSASRFAVFAAVPFAGRESLLHLRRHRAPADIHDEPGHRARAQPPVRQLDHRWNHERGVYPGRFGGHAVLCALVRPAWSAACRIPGARFASGQHARLRVRRDGPCADCRAVRPRRTHGTLPVFHRRARAHALGIRVARQSGRVVAEHRIRPRSRSR